MKAIRIQSRAFQELQAAIFFYEETREGLGVKFEQFVNDSLSQIQSMPQASSFLTESIRYKVLKKYPYIILYEELSTEIVILRVFNEKRKPFKI